MVYLKIGESMENEVNKEKKKIYIIITIWILIILIIGGILITYCVNNNSKKKESNIQENSDVEAEYENKRIELMNLGTYQIKLGNRKVDVIVSGESAHREVMIDNKKVDVDLDCYGIINVINNEVIMISQSKGYGSETALYFYDSDINNINTDFKFEDGYTMKPDDVVKVEENILTVKATNESVLNNYSTGDDYVTFCKKINIDDYKGQLREAKYEIKYLGNGLFSSPRRIGEEKYIEDECQRVTGNSIEYNKVINARKNGSYWIEKGSRDIPLTIRINSTNDKEATLIIDYDSEYIKDVYKEIAESGIKDYPIKFDKNIKKVFIGEGSMTTGAGYETVFYLLEDGTIEYTPLAHALGYDFKTYKCTGKIDIKSYGKVDQSITDVTDIIRGGFALDSPYVGGGAITIAKRNDGYWYDLTNFLEKTPFY